MVDHDSARERELDELLARASVSALTTLDTRIDVARLLRELRGPADGRRHTDER